MAKKVSARQPKLFYEVGESTQTISVRLSYKIIDLFSEGLYSSPNKAIEELVANSFDAGATTVHIMMSNDLHHPRASIAVLDNGAGMDDQGLDDHWLIGRSKKREMEYSGVLKGRAQIGKFGIGKLATYVLAKRLTHISKKSGKFYSTSMDFEFLGTGVEEIEPTEGVEIDLRALTAAEAKAALAPWINTKSFEKWGVRLFGRAAPRSWTAAIMSPLKEKVQEIKPGLLEWILRTAMPLRDDFSVCVDGKQLVPSKKGKGVVKEFVLGKDISTLPKPAPPGLSRRHDTELGKSDPKHCGLYHPNLGRITGYAEVYEDLLTGKSDLVGRSYGFFVYARGRLLNVDDGHFGIEANELRHGTFGRFRLAIHIDRLDDLLRSNRESLREGPMLEDARNLLRAIFNFARSQLEEHDTQEQPGRRLARKIAGSPSSLSRQPIIDLTRDALYGQSVPRYLKVPAIQTDEGREAFLDRLSERSASAEDFITDIELSYESGSDGGIAFYDTETGRLLINALHPFVGTFIDDFSANKRNLSLQLIAMAEVLLEAHLHHFKVTSELVDDILDSRDQLLRSLAKSSGRKTALMVSQELNEARNNKEQLEIQVVAAFNSLGFDAHRESGSGKPDGVASAHLPAVKSGQPGRYSVTLEAKSKEKAGKKVSAKGVGISTIARHRKDFGADHAIVVAPDFPSTAPDSALFKEIDEDRKTHSQKKGESEKTITLMRIEDLSRLVRLQPLKRVNLSKIRDLFLRCRTPDECNSWIDEVEQSEITVPPYREILETIHEEQKVFHKEIVEYGQLQSALNKRTPSINFEEKEELIQLCKALEQMALGFVAALSRGVELNTSPDQVLEAIRTTIDQYPIDERPASEEAD